MADLSLDEQVVAIAQALTERGIPYALGGALAYNYYGVPRYTGDIDFNVFVSAEQGQATIDCLSRLGVDVERPDPRFDLLRDGQVRLFWQGTPVDLFFAYHAFHEACDARARTVVFANSRVRILSAEDLVVFKVIFNRTKDWPDIERILAGMQGTFDLPYALHWIGAILGADDSRYARIEEMAAAANQWRQADPR